MRSTSVAPNELETFGAMLATHGLTVAPLEKVAVADSYANSLEQTAERVSHSTIGAP